MTKDEIPRGQLSTIILLTLQDKDKYGYEIIDEVLKNTYGKVSIKQPSLYSSLKRMEEQSLISSYWRDSEIGGKRHYYHLTDLGKKHLDKWKEDLPEIYRNPVKEDNHTRVLQQENLFNLTKKEIEFQDKITLNQNKQNTFVQFDLFSNSTIVTPPSFDDDEISIDTSKNTLEIDHENSNLPKTTEQKPILTEYTKPLEIKTSAFTYLKKTNKSFSDTFKHNSTNYEKKYVETNTISTPYNENTDDITLEEKTNKIDIKSLKNYNINSMQTLESDFSDDSKGYVNDIKQSQVITDSKNNIDKDILKESDRINENISTIYDLDLNAEQSIDRQFDVNCEAKDNSNNSQIINSVQNGDVDLTVETKNDDGVIITERIDIKDLPKAYKWDNTRRFDLYVDPSAMPKLSKSNKLSNYEDRVRDLYEQSKNSSDNQKLQLIDTKTKFVNYKNLQEFYNEQNIKFKPFIKSLKTTNKDYNMIKINKLKTVSSFTLTLIYTVLSLILGLCFGKQQIYLNSPITYLVLPFIFLSISLLSLIEYMKAPQKRISLNINKYNFNIKYMLISILIIPIVVAINMLFGFNFTNFMKFSLPIIVPSLLSLYYIFNYITIKILLKTKKF